jgi:hypothetical protein
MPKEENSLEPIHHHFEEGVKLIFRGLIPIVLLLSGMGLLFLRLPGWSIIFGLPLVTFGVVFLIYTYDEVVSKRVLPIPKAVVKCSVCGQPTPQIPGVAEEDTICAICKRKIRNRIKGEVKSLN